MVISLVLKTVETFIHVYSFGRSPLLRSENLVTCLNNVHYIHHYFEWPKQKASGYKGDHYVVNTYKIYICENKMVFHSFLTESRIV